MKSSIILPILALCITGSFAQVWDCSVVPDNTIIPHPESCYQFVICHNGIGHEMTCSDGLHWNTEAQTCDWPANANCQIEGPETGDCPATDDHTSPIFFPNKELCARFFMCCGGNKISMYCGNNFHWNEETNFCDHPENAQCDYDSDLNIDINCPAVGVHWIPHPDSCAHFFICYNGSGTLQRCPTNQYWNVITEECDVAANVICDIECPETGLAWIPHPQSCHHYFLCFDGDSDLRTCAPGLNFDPITNTCNFEDLVECQI